MSKKVFVVGCGRSGTLYMKEVLKVCGLDVDHERAGEDGITSWFHSFGNRQKRLLKFDYPDTERFFIHLVRNPIEAINSIHRVSFMRGRYALGYFKDLCPDAAEDYQGLELAMTYWVFWNKMTEVRGARVDRRIKVEEVATEKELWNICYGAGIEYHDHYLTEVMELGNRVHEIKGSKRADLFDAHPELAFNASLEDMRGINPGLCKKVEDLAKTYGYELE